MKKGLLRIRTVLLPVLLVLVLATYPARGEESMPEPEPENSCGEGEEAGPQCDDFFGKYLDDQGKQQPAASVPAEILQPAEQEISLPASPAPQKE